MCGEKGMPAAAVRLFEDKGTAYLAAGQLGLPVPPLGSGPFEFQAAEQLKNSMPTDLAILKDSMPTYKWAPAGKMSEADFARGVEVLSSMGMFAKVSPEQVKASYTTTHQK